MLRRFFCALVALTALAVFSAPASAEPISGFVRLHVVAEGDSDWEQQVKLAVRDACLETARELLSECEGADGAYALLNANLPKFRTAAASAANGMGFEGAIAVETGAFEFPDRLYGEVFVPAGEYRALRITLGAGEGHNWWCVLYPSLCVLDESAYFAGEQPPIEFYSSIGQFLSGAFGG
ncbi:MAG: stage II sporulation protein R [Clostridiales bacterium]|nr:stage II sporulation protein R [Clostridiales bacterium]